jgi:AraC-like DNA-binding protein
MAIPSRQGRSTFLRSEALHLDKTGPSSMKELVDVVKVHGESVIIVGAPELARALVRAGRTRVVAFSSLRDLDRWRESELADETFGPDLIAAFEEIGCTLSGLPRKLRRQLEALAGQLQVPPMSALAQEWPSRRSFYRVWNDNIPETPSALLRRLRARHAKRLIAMGRSKKEAAFLAGFSSADQMRRSISK